MLIPIYLVILLFSTLICLKGLSMSLMYAPIKINIVISSVFIGLFFKFSTLLIFSIVKNIRYLYIFEPLYFIDLLCIPMGIITVLYIFIRKDKLKFSYIIIFNIILAITYIFVILKLDINLQINKYSIYTMYFDKQILVYLISVFFNLVFLALAIFNLKSPSSIKVGLIMVIISSIVVITEIVFSMMGIKILPESILGELCWCIALIYGMLKLKKQ